MPPRRSTEAADPCPTLSMATAQLCLELLGAVKIGGADPDIEETARRIALARRELEAARDHAAKRAAPHD